MRYGCIHLSSFEFARVHLSSFECLHSNVCTRMLHSNVALECCTRMLHWNVALDNNLDCSTPFLSKNMILILSTSQQSHNSIF